MDLRIMGQYLKIDISCWAESSFYSQFPAIHPETGLGMCQGGLRFSRRGLNLP